MEGVPLHEVRGVPYRLRTLRPTVGDFQKETHSWQGSRAHLPRRESLVAELDSAPTDPVRERRRPAAPWLLITDPRQARVGTAGSSQGGLSRPANCSVHRTWEEKRSPAGNSKKMCRGHLHCEDSAPYSGRVESQDSS